MNKVASKSKPVKLVLLCHNVRSAYNVGSFFRTADGAGVNKIVLSGYSACPPHPGVIKTALGAEQMVDWEFVIRPGPWLCRMRRAGYRIVALEQTPRSKNIFRYKMRKPTILIVGNEVRGISPALLKQCDDVVHIPMRGQKESLNVASAMAIAVYSLRNSP